MEYTFCAKVGKVYDPGELNKKYGLDEDTPKDNKFQEDTIYFREEKEKKMEYWDEKDRVSIILEEFLDLYNFDMLTLDIGKTTSFIEKYGMPLCSDIAGNNSFLGIDFSVKAMSRDPRFFYDTLPKKDLTHFYFFLRSLVSLVIDESLDDKNMQRQCFKFYNMLYLLISPFMEDYWRDEYVNGDIAVNHIPEINKQNIFFPFLTSVPRLCGFRLTEFEHYERELEERKKEYRKAGEKERGTSNTWGEYSSEDMFAITNVVDHEENLKRVDLILEFLRVVKKTDFYFDIDNQGCLIKVDGNSDELVVLDEEDKGIIEKIIPLFIKDYLDYLIQKCRQVVIEESQGYAFGMQLDTMGAILFGLLCTLESKKYMRKCMNCERLFYPAKTHPKQRSCGHKCSDILYKKKKRKEKIKGVPFEDYTKTFVSLNHS